MNNLMTKGQLKEAKYIYDEWQLKDLAKDDPDALLVWEDSKNQAVISKYDDTDNCYEDAVSFLQHRLAVNKNDLNALASEMGYDGSKTGWKRPDLIADLVDDNEDSLLQLVSEQYDGKRLGDIYNV